MFRKLFTTAFQGTFLLWLLIFLPTISHAQVGVNTDGSSAVPSAMLDVKSTTRGMLIPRMNTGERTDISAPATGLLVFDTDTNSFWFFNGTEWEQLVSASLLPGPVVISPPLISSDKSDYNPSGFGTATVVRLSADDGFRMITGFASETDGEEKTIVNVGDHPFYLAPEHQNSTEENRLAFFEEVVIPPGQSCRIVYDATSERWRPLNPPCSNYTNIQRSIHYDKSAGKVPDGFQDDIHLDVFGTLAQGTDPPSASSPFGSWYLSSGTSPSGGLGLFFPRSSEEMAYVGSTHIVAKIHIKTPANLSDESDSYYYFLRIANSPSSGFWNQNNSLGLRYRHDVNGGKWQCYSRSDDGTDTVLDTGIPFEVNTEYEQMVTLNKSNSEATYYINGEVVGRITSNLPTPISVGVSFHFEKLSGTTARAFRVYRFMGAAIEP